jgi:hypothetical protein
MEAVKIKKTVDDYLDAVDYEELKKYKPSEFAITYLNFIKMVNASGDYNNSPPAHFKMVDGLCDKNQYLANLCSRGLSKTSVFAEFLIPFLAIFREIPGFGLVDTAIYVADTMENGAKNLRKNIEFRYNQSEFLQKYLPEAKFTDSYIEFTNIDGKKFGLKLFGATTGLRGTKIFGKRPVLAILDDLLSDEAASSPTTLDKVKDTIYKGVIPALDPRRRKVIFNGTPFNKNDPLYEAVESGSWVVNVYPVCEEFPCSREDFRGAWEERFSYDSVMAQYQLAKGSEQVKSFRQEMMLRITSDDDRMILDSDVRWFNTPDVMKNKGDYNFYITTDFATSTARKADFTVIGVWAIDSEGNRYLVDGRIGRQLMNQTFDDLFALVRQYNPMGVGIEVSGQQGAFISLIKNEMGKRDCYFTLARSKDSSREGIPAKSNKMERFRLTIPFWKNGKFYLPKDQKNSRLITELTDEISMVTIDGIKSKHDDVLDMISQLEQMYIVPPDPKKAVTAQPIEHNMFHFNDTDLNHEHNQSDYLV